MATQIFLADKATLDATKSNTDTIKTNVGSNADVASASGSVHAKIKDLKTALESSGKMKSQLFTSNGSFTVPAGVTVVWITAISGGAGGGGGINGGDYDSGKGGNGGVTSFGAFLSLIGGAGGGGASQYSGNIAAGGTNSLTDVPPSASYANGNPGNTNNGAGGPGWYSSFGKGGDGGTGSRRGGGGASGVFIKDYPIPVTPGAAIPITIGSPGSPGVGNGGGRNGANGGPGALLVSWS